MTRDSRGSMSLVAVLAVVGTVVAAGVVGGVVVTDTAGLATAGNETATPTAGENATTASTSTQSAAETPTATATQTATAAETQTATATATPTPTATPEPRNVTVIIEHWEDNVGIIIQGGPDADAITELRVEGATMNTTMDLDARYPKARGTVTADTVRVIATFEDGTTQVIAKRTLE